VLGRLPRSASGAFPRLLAGGNEEFS
jgi:hypothetical protein